MLWGASSLWGAGTLWGGVVAMADAFENAIFDLLPPGKYWRKTVRTTRLAHMIQGLSIEFGRQHDKVLSLIEEADPRTTTDMLDNWEELVGLPDPCVPSVYQPATIPDRRAAVTAKWTSYGGQSASYLEGVADTALGVAPGTVQIFEGSWAPFIVSQSRVGDALNAAGSQFIFIVRAPAATSAAKQAQLECTIDRIKPAHTVAWYEYVL